MPTSASLIPKNGAIVYGSLVADYNAFTLTKRQNSEEVTPYGSNTCAKNVGNGTPTFDFTIAAFALAHNAATAPAMATAAAAGVAATFTLDTGVTEAAQLVETMFKISHGRMKAAVPYDIEGKNYSDLTETWPLT